MTWDQFAANAQMFGVKADTFDENLYTTKLPGRVNTLDERAEDNGAMEPVSPKKVSRPPTDLTTTNNPAVDCDTKKRSRAEMAKSGISPKEDMRAHGQERRDASPSPVPSPPRTSAEMPNFPPPGPPVSIPYIPPENILAKFFASVPPPASYAPDMPGPTMSTSMGMMPPPPPMHMHQSEAMMHHHAHMFHQGLPAMGYPHPMHRYPMQMHHLPPPPPHAMPPHSLQQELPSPHHEKEEQMEVEEPAQPEIREVGSRACILIGDIECSLEDQEERIEQVEPFRITVGDVDCCMLEDEQTLTFGSMPVETTPSAERPCPPLETVTETLKTKLGGKADELDDTVAQSDGAKSKIEAPKKDYQARKRHQKHISRQAGGRVWVAKAHPAAVA